MATPRAQAGLGFTVVSTRIDEMLKKYGAKMPAAAVKGLTEASNRAKKEAAACSIPSFLSITSLEALEDVEVGYAQMGVGEEVQLKITRSEEDVDVVVLRTIENNGTISGSARQGTPPVTSPQSSVVFGRIPTERAPGEEPPPVDPPDPGVVPGWSPFGAAFDVSGDPVVKVTSDGTYAYFTMNSDVGTVEDSKVGRVYTASVNVRGAVGVSPATGVGAAAKLVIRERLSDGTTSESQSTITLTGSYAPLEVSYTAKEEGRPVDVRVSVTAAQGAAFQVQTVPEFSFTDPVTPPGGSPGSAFDRPFYPSALVNTKTAGRAIANKSADYVTELVNRIKDGKVFTFNGGEAPPIIRSNHSTMVEWTVSVGGYSQKWYMPADVNGGGGSDNPLVVRDENHDYHGSHAELRLWKVVISNRANRQMTATNYGVFRFNNDGVKLDGGRHSVGRSIDNDGGRGAGNGLTYTAGMIIAADIRAGVINHVLRFSHGPGSQTASGPINNQKVPPAIKSDQSGTGTWTIPMGSIYRLKPTVVIANRTVPGDGAKETAFLQMFLKALQDYGMMVGDGTGSGPGFYMESNLTADWTSLIGTNRTDAGGYGWILRSNLNKDAVTQNRRATDGVPWEEMELVEPWTAENLT